MPKTDYYPDFEDNVADARKILYSLEELGITKIEREKQGKGVYGYRWRFTKKGQKIVDENKYLQSFWEDGKLREFYREVKSLLDSDKK